MKGKKGQLQIHETIMVIFILVVIILLGLILFYKFTASGIHDDYNQNKLLRFKAMMATLPEIGEIKCSIYGQEDNCIDSYKIIVMNTLFKVDPNYKNYLVERYGFMEIKLGLVYPYANNAECNSGLTKNCGVWMIYSHVPSKYIGLQKISTPISVYLPLDNTYGIGVLNITRYIIE